MVDKLKEQVYVIPLGTVRRVPRWRRSAKAMKDIREFLGHHMKSEDVKLHSSINRRSGPVFPEPPARIRVRPWLEDGQVQARARVRWTAVSIKSDPISAYSPASLRIPRSSSDAPERSRQHTEAFDPILSEPRSRAARHRLTCRKQQRVCCLRPASRAEVKRF